MSRPAEVPGRPAWCRGETLEVQAMIVASRLTQQQFRVLREFAAVEDLAAPRMLAHSTARALRDRGLGELEGKQALGSMAREHPKASFMLNADGRAFVGELKSAGLAIEPLPVRAGPVPRNAGGRRDTSARRTA